MILSFSVRVVGGMLPRKILKLRVSEMRFPAFWGSLRADFITSILGKRSCWLNKAKHVRFSLYGETDGLNNNWTKLIFYFSNKILQKHIHWAEQRAFKRNIANLLYTAVNCLMLIDVSTNYTSIQDETKCKYNMFMTICKLSFNLPRVCRDIWKFQQYNNTHCVTVSLKRSCLCSVKTLSSIAVE